MRRARKEKSFKKRLFRQSRKKSSKNPIPLPARNGVSKSLYHAFPPIKRIGELNSERILAEWEGISRV
jgi:hypothetical protein